MNSHVISIFTLAILGLFTSAANPHGNRRDQRGLGLPEIPGVSALTDNSIVNGLKGITGGGANALGGFANMGGDLAHSFEGTLDQIATGLNMMGGPFAMFGALANQLGGGLGGNGIGAALDMAAEQLYNLGEIARDELKSKNKNLAAVVGGGQ